MRYLTECGPLFAFGLTQLMETPRQALKARLWPLVVSCLVIWNGLLIMAYGLGTISRSYCTSYVDMAVGVGQAVARLAKMAT